MRPFLALASLILFVGTASATEPAARKYRSGALTYKEVVRDSFGKKEAGELLTRPVRKQLNRMSAGRSHLDTDKLSLEETDPKTGAERGVYNTPVGLVASTHTPGGPRVTRVAGKQGTQVSTSFEAGKRIPSRLREVAGAEKIRRGDQVRYRFAPNGDVHADVVRVSGGTEMSILSADVPRK